MYDVCNVVSCEASVELWRRPWPHQFQLGPDGTERPNQTQALSGSSAQWWIQVLWKESFFGGGGVNNQFKANFSTDQF